MEYIYTVPQKKVKKRYIPYYHLYVLLLENDKYYVGISRNVRKRFNTHLSGEGAEWTKLYKPIKILLDSRLPYCSYAKVKPYEDRETVEMMKVHGRENVRGGVYCAVDQSVVDSILGEEACKEIDNSVIAFKRRKQKQIENRKRKRKRNVTVPLNEKLRGFTIIVYDITKVSLPRARMHLAREYVRVSSGQRGFINIPVEVDYRNYKIYISNMEMARHKAIFEDCFNDSSINYVTTLASL